MDFKQQQQQLRMRTKNKNSIRKDFFFKIND